MREVLAELMRWWRAGETRRRRHGRRDVALGAPARRRVDAGRARRRGGRQRVRRLRRGRGLRAAPGGASTSGRPVPAALRRQRRRRVRGRADLRRHPRRVRRDASTARRFPELGEVAADIEAGRPVAVATVIAHPDRAQVGRRLVVRPEDSAEPVARHARLARAPTPRSPTTSAGCSPAAAPRRCTYGPDGERRGEGHAGVRARRTRPGRGCSSSARSTSPPRWPGWAASSATG